MINRDDTVVLPTHRSTSATAEIVVVGLNHRTSSIDVRERVALSPERRDAALRILQGQTNECVVVSTCNRVELYVVVDPGQLNVENITDFLARFHGLDPLELSPHLYVRRGSAAVRHIFSVACGLDSMIVGEPQILGQIRADYEAAVVSGSVGPILSRVVQSALRVGKQVRTVTGISRPAGSVSSAVVELARRVRGDLRETSVLVIGTGVMGEQAARTVATSGVAQLVVANRTYARALDLATRLGGRAAELTMLPTLVENADIVISGTGAPMFVLDRFLVREAMRRRPDRPLLLVDIAVPRDIDPLVGEIDNVMLRDIDDLQQVGAVNLEDRRRDVVEARRLVDAEVQAFERWLATREVVPTIAALRDRCEDIRQAEVRKAIGLMGELTDRQRVAVEAMSSAIVKKLLHVPITQLKAESMSIDGRAEKLSTARQFFGLDIDGPVPVGRIAHRRSRGVARR